MKRRRKAARTASDASPATQRESSPSGDAPVVAGTRATTGTLFIVATPIGNLSDCSERLATTLASCSLVLCEDTRRTAILLRHLGVAVPLLTCHEHDEESRVASVVQRLAAGESIALVSDAGTPCISDPGYRLVRAVHAAGLRASPVPGPSAVTAALSACGLPTSSFAFEGFLPRKRSARRRLLAQLADEPRTLVFLETPHRVQESLADLVEIFGSSRPACLAREMTKLHEEVRLADLGELATDAAARPPRGEIVLVVGAAEAAVGSGATEGLAESVSELVSTGLSEREALRRVARDRGLTRRDVYRALKVRDEEE